jgi:hypothetical protein
VLLLCEKKVRAKKQFCYGTTQNSRLVHQRLITNRNDQFLEKGADMVDFREAAIVFVHQVDSLAGQLREIQERVEKIAYENFLVRGAIHGRDLEDWFEAESAVLVKPDWSIQEERGEIIMHADLAQISFTDPAVFVTPNDALFTGSMDRGGKVFAIFSFPRPIATDSVDAELDGNVFRFVANFVQSSRAVASSA